MKILIAGDLVPTKSNEQLFIEGKIEVLLGKELMETWSGADYRIVNLEAPYIEKEYPIEKNGPNLIVSPECINGIRKMKVNLACLANNHILDQGMEGLASTISLLNEAKIDYLGTYNNKPSYNVSENIAVYACCENEFSVNYNLELCANGWDEKRCLDEIKELKNKNEKVIVLFHGGKEHYRYPSPGLQQTCRLMIDNGADIVICQHTHCIGCKEKYGQGVIVYGQGNFIFDANNNNEYWKTSLIIQLDIDEKIDVKFIPIIKNNNIIEVAAENDAKDIMMGFETRSDEILNNNFIEERYSNFAIIA